jgi:hypothetical protein
MRTPPRIANPGRTARLRGCTACDHEHPDALPGAAKQHRRSRSGRDARARLSACRVRDARTPALRARWMCTWSGCS